MKNSVCVVIPMYNEEKIAARCVDGIEKELSKIKSTVGFIVVEAASKDKTSRILQDKKSQYKKMLEVINLKKNSGYGGALREGTKKAQRLGYGFVLFMDSDLTNNPQDIPKFVNMASDKVDCVKATRYSRGGRMEGVPLYRQLISRVGNWFASRSFDVGLTDCTNGFRMVRVEMLKSIKLREKGFVVILEELYELKKKGARFSSIPVILTSRINTKTHFSYSWKTFFDYGKYTLKATFL